MADKTLRYRVVGQDVSAGKTLDQVGTKAGKAGGALSKLGGSIKGGLIGIASSIAVGEIVDFGQAAVDAFQDAEKSQRALADAYRRFPALQDVSIAKLREQAAAIQAKTGADADDIAASQAVLARYKLTGAQLQQVTPLLVDYAKRTGKDLPQAAGVLGKAMMGSGRAMKELGINFKDAKDPAKNLDQIMAGLRKTVGGYANKEAQTAAGKTEIMRARLGDLQESIGGKLEPVMGKLLDAGNKILDWLDANPAVIEGASAAFDGLIGVVEWLVDVLGGPLAAILSGNIKLFAVVTEQAANMLDALSVVPGFGWAKGAADTLRKVSTGAHAAADGLQKVGKQRVIVNTSAGEKNVSNLRKRIDGIKGKIVTAKANGDTREVDRLNKKLRDMRKQYNIAVRARMSGSGTISVSQQGGKLWKMRAFRQGGRPKVGELAQFHADEIWAPDQAGTVISQSKSRQIMQSGGPGAIGGGPSINIMVAGDTDPDAAARRIAAKLGKYFRNGGTINGGKVGR